MDVDVADGDALLAEEGAFAADSGLEELDTGALPAGLSPAAGSLDALPSSKFSEDDVDKITHSHPAEGEGVVPKSMTEFHVNFDMSDAPEESSGTDFLIKRKAARRRALDRARGKLAVFLGGQVRADITNVIGSDSLNVTVEAVARHYGIDIHTWTLQYSKSSYEQMVDGKPYVFTTGVYSGQKLNLFLDHPFYDKKIARRLAMAEKLQREKREEEERKLAEAEAQNPPKEVTAADRAKAAKAAREAEEAAAAAAAEAEAAAAEEGAENDATDAPPPKQERMPENTVPPGSLVDYSRFDISRIALPTEAHWRDAIRDQPWDLANINDVLLNKAIMKCRLPLDTSKPDGDDLAVEGMHQLWEFASRKSNHPWLLSKDDFAECVLEGSASDSLRVRALAMCTLWSSSVTKLLRKKFTAGGAVKLTLANLRLIMQVPETEPHNIDEVMEMCAKEDRRQVRKAELHVINQQKKSSLAQAARTAIKLRRVYTSKSGEVQDLVADVRKASAAPVSVSLAGMVSDHDREEEEKVRREKEEAERLEREREEAEIALMGFPKDEEEVDKSLGISGIKLGILERKQHYSLLSSEARWRLMHASVGALGLLLLDKAARMDYLRDDPTFELLLRSLQKVPTDHLCFCPMFAVPLEYGRTLADSRGWYYDDRRLRSTENLVSMLMRDADVRTQFMRTGGADKLLGLMGEDDTPVTQKYLYTQAMSVFAANPKALATVHTDEGVKGAKINLTGLKLMRESSADILDAFQEMSESLDLCGYGHDTSVHVRGILSKRPFDLNDDDEARLALQWAMSSAVIYWTGIGGMIEASKSNSFHYLITVEDLKRQLLLLEQCIVLIYYCPVETILYCLTGSLALLCSEQSVLKRLMKVVGNPNAPALREIFQTKGLEVPDIDDVNTSAMINLTKILFHLPNPPEGESGLKKMKACMLTSLANISAHNFGAMYDDCLVGPYRMMLIEENMFLEIIGTCMAEESGTAHEAHDDNIDLAASIALMYMCTAGQVDEVNHCRTKEEIFGYMQMVTRSWNLRPALCFIAGTWVLLRVRENRLKMLIPEDEEKPLATPRLLIMLEAYALKWMSALEADRQDDPGEDPAPEVADAIKAFEFWISSLWLGLVDEPEYDHIPMPEEVYEMAAPPEAKFQSWFSVPSRTPVNLSRIPTVSIRIVQTLVHILSLPRHSHTTTGDGYWRCRLLVIRLCWSLCIRDGRIQRDLLDNGILPALMDVIDDTWQRVDVRRDAVWLTMYLASQIFNVTEFFPNGSTSELEDSLINLIRDQGDELARVGMLSLDYLLYRPCNLQLPQAKEAAACTRAAQLRFVPNAGAECTLALLRRHFRALLDLLEARVNHVVSGRTLRSRQKKEAETLRLHTEMCDLALIGLRNCTTQKDNQVPIAKMGLHILLIAHAAFSHLGYENHAVHTSYIIRNLSTHPQNRTRFYKMELRGVWSLLAKQSQEILDANDAQTRFFLAGNAAALSDRSHYKGHALLALDKTKKRLGLPVARGENSPMIAGVSYPKADFFRANETRPPSSMSENSDTTASGSERGPLQAEASTVSSKHEYKRPSLVDQKKIEFLDWIDATFVNGNIEIKALPSHSRHITGEDSLAAASPHLAEGPAGVPNASGQEQLIEDDEGALRETVEQFQNQMSEFDEDADDEVKRINVKRVEQTAEEMQKHLGMLRKLVDTMFAPVEGQQSKDSKSSKNLESLTTPRRTTADFVRQSSMSHGGSSSRLSVRQSGSFVSDFLSGRQTKRQSEEKTKGRAKRLERMLAGEDRAPIPSVHKALKKPLRNIYREPAAETARKGKERWNPPLEEYRQPVEPQEPMPRVAKKLLNVRRPEKATVDLALAAQELALLRGNDGPAVGGGHLERPESVQSVVKDRPVSRDGFKRDDVPLTVLLPPANEKLPRSDSAESLRDMYIKTVVPKLRLPVLEAAAEEEKAAAAAAAEEEKARRAAAAGPDGFGPNADPLEEEAVDDDDFAVEVDLEKQRLDDAMPEEIRHEWIPKEKRSLQVILTPSRPRNAIGFARDPTRPTPKMFARMDDPLKRPKLTMFEHVRGSKIGRTHFPCYMMPNGKMSHYFYSRGDVADEVEVFLPAGPMRPVDLHLAMQARLPIPHGLEKIQMPDASSLPSPYFPIPRTCRDYPDVMPEEELANSDRQPPIDTMANDRLACQPLRMKITTEPVELERTGKVEKEVRPPWNINASVFAPRRKECESRAYYDSEALIAKMFEKDWEHLTNKRKVCSMMMTEGKKSGKAPPEIMSSVKSVLAKYKIEYIKCFNFYACCQSGNPLLASLNEYTEFIIGASIADPESLFCKTSDLDTIFITSNFQEDKKMPQNSRVVNNEKQLMRFEFLECLIRISVAKYMKDPVVIADLSVALDKLMTDHLVASLSNEAVYDSNLFRKERLYFEENDILYKKHLPTLKAIYQRYRLPPQAGAVRTKLMRLEGWSLFLENAGLVTTDFTLTEARLCWLWCRMLTSDEVGMYEHNVKVTFVDFLDALGRTADFMTLPTELEWKKHGFKNILDWKFTRDNSPDQLDPEGKPIFVSRESSKFGTPKTRPLHIKLHSLLDMTFRALDYHPGEEFEYDQLRKRMMKLDKELGP